MSLIRRRATTRPEATARQWATARRRATAPAALSAMLAALSVAGGMAVAATPTGATSIHTTATMAKVAKTAVAKTAAAKASSSRPNIVFILTDDLDQRTTPIWQALPKTAALLRDRGLTFERNFAPTPICCAARSTILTGKYGHNTGVLTNAGDVGGWESFYRNGNEEKTFAKYLHDAGYRTGLAGKYLNGIEDDPTHIPVGWDEWNGGVDNFLYLGYNYTLNQNGTMVRYGHAPADYETDVVAGLSDSFIRRAAADGTPFLWYAASTAPHFPIQPAPRDRDNPFAHAIAPHLPNFQERDVSDKPSWLKQTATVRSAEVAATNNTDYQNRMGSLYAVDDMVAKIVNTLRDTGQLDNTYLVFTSDNGYNLGAHRLVQKMAPYEESLEVPMVITGPGVRQGVEHRMALQTDLAPTFLDLAGLAEPADMDGVSLAPLLRGRQPDTWRQDFVAQYAGPGASGTNGIYQENVPGNPQYVVDVPSWSAVRDTRYLYVRWYDRERPEKGWEYELYDLAADPYQLSNLLATPAGQARYASVVSQLNARLGQLVKCSGATCRT